MDHLPFLHSSVGSWPCTLDVPYIPLTENSYDGTGLRPFIEEKRADMRRLVYDFAYLCEDPISAGLPYIKEDFLYTVADGKQIVITTQLPRYIYHWHAYESSNNGAIFQERAREYSQKFIKVINCLESFEGMGEWSRTIDRNAFEGNQDWLDPFSDRYPQASVIILSIRLLVQTLSYAANNIYSTYAWNDQQSIWERDLEFNISNWNFPQALGLTQDFLQYWLLKAGWCPREIACMQAKTGSIPAQLFHLQEDRWHLGESHQQCTPLYCEARTLYSAQYLQKHRPGCTGCASVGPSVPEDSAEGWAFAVQLRGQSLETVPVLPKLRKGQFEFYVAISHVWSDGMGNPHKNELPFCILQYIQNKVNEACGSEQNMPFWMDTLCVPVHAEQVRRTVIKAMSMFYLAAKLVLILDHSLETRHLPASEERMNLALTTSVWNQRLWTLQESHLARRKAIVFQDVVYHPPLFFHNLANLESRYQQLPQIDASMTEVKPNHPEVRNTCASTLQRVVSEKDVSAGAQQSGSSFRDQKTEVALLYKKLAMYEWEQPHLKFVRVALGNNMSDVNPETLDRTGLKTWRIAWRMIQSLRWRQTSRLEDEPLCLAITSEVPLGPLLEAPVADRMKLFLLKIWALPKRMIFFTGERYEEEGFRWAPKSFLLRETPDTFCEQQAYDTTLPEGIQLGRASEDGFQVSFPGIVVDTVAPELRSKDQRDVLHAKSGRGMKYAITFFQGHDTHFLPIGMHRFRYRKMAIVMRTAIDNDANSVGATNGLALSVEPGSQMRKIIRGRFEGLCLVHDATRYSRLGNGKGGRPEDEELKWSDKDFENCFIAEEKANSQSWLIR